MSNTNRKRPNRTLTMSPETWETLERHREASPMPTSISAVAERLIRRGDEAVVAEGKARDKGRGGR